MKTKEIKIKDLKPGMKIKSYDADTREIVFSTVNDVWNTVVKKQDQRHLIFENGAEIHCSNRHPIMVLRETVIQVLPDDLTTDDLIIVDGLPTKLKQCLTDDLDENYIDIEVEGTNLFFAKSTNDTNMILTHNCSQGGVRGGCVQKDSFVEKIVGFEFNGMKFEASKQYKIDGKWVNISQEIKTLAYLGNDNERTAYLSSLFGQNPTIEETLDNNP